MLFLIILENIKIDFRLMMVMNVCMIVVMMDMKYIIIVILGSLFFSTFAF